MNPNPEFAKTKLDEASHTKDRARRTAWMMLILGLSLLVALTVALVDYWWLLPRAARLAGFLALVALAAVGVAHLAGMLRRPASLKEVALDVESRDPKLGCTISTAAEYLSGERKITHEYEPGLVAALETQAANLLEPVKLPYWQRILLPGALCVMGALVVLSFLVSASGAFTAFKRTAAPWSSAAYTQVEVKPGNAEVPAGSDLEIKSVFTGRLPKDARINWREVGASRWEAAELTKTEDGAYACALKDIQKATQYRVSGGDAVSSEFRIEAYIPPAVKEMRVQVDYPAHTRLKPITQIAPDITAVRGSTATFSLEPTVKLAGARLVADKLPSVDLAPGPGGLWTGTLPIKQDANYRLELRDVKGRLGLNNTTNHIKALPDEPPKVEIVQPGADSRASATNTVTIQISIADDYGVENIQLVYHKLGGPDRILPVKRTGGTTNEATASVDLPLGPLNLKEFELVAYHAEARDNNAVDGPGVGKSPLYFIEINEKEGSQPKGPPPPQPGQKLNLLVLQKQIIANSRALDKDAPADQFNQLALREKDVAEFAQMYLDGMSRLGAPPAAVDLMYSAMRDLTNAATALQARQRDAALPPEEQALAGFYQVLKLLPELENMPTQPPPPTQARTNAPPSQMLQVVLEAIKKQMRDQTDNQELAEMMEEAQQLSQAQASLNHLVRGQANAKGKGGGNVVGRQADAGPDEKKPETQADKKNGEHSQTGEQADFAKGQDGKNGQNGKDGQGQDGQGAGDRKAGKGQGKDGKGQGENGQGQGEGQGKNGQGQGMGEGKNGQGKQGQNGKGEGEGEGEGQGNGKGKGKGEGGQQGDGMDGLADEKQRPAEDRDQPELAKDQPESVEKEQEQLSEEAKELAEKLARLADKDARLGHNIPKAMKNAAKNMDGAAQGIKAGDRVGASRSGTQAVYELNSVAAMLQKIIEAESQLGDVSNEEYPAEFEVAIRDYLKRLSYQE